MIRTYAKDEDCNYIQQRLVKDITTSSIFICPCVSPNDEDAFVDRPNTSISTEEVQNNFQNVKKEDVS